METKKAPERGTLRLYLKIFFFVVALVLAFFGGKEFYELRHYKETVVSAPGLTEVKMLSDYLDNLKGTWMDTPIFVYDSGVSGGSVLYMANVHPYEPATSLSAYIMMENIKVTKGKIFVIPQGNRSASTTGMLANAYPKFFTIETEFGGKKYRIGDRGTNPLDQWPDPFTYVNYPSKQNLAYQDIRNMNRTYPGRKDGTLTERASYAIMELIRQEKIDLSIDAHEASLMYPVVGTYVAHERSFDRVVGTMTEELFTEGKDEFLATAAEHGLTYVPYNLEFGSPLWYRCGRHLTGALEIQNTAANLIKNGQKDTAIELLTTYAYNNAEKWHKEWLALGDDLLGTYMWGNKDMKLQKPNAWWSDIMSKAPIKPLETK